jgi:hypothetical protein
MVSTAHVVALADRTRVRCMCGAPAAMTEHSRWAIPTDPPTRGISFYPYCADCWVKPGPAAPSPAERTGVAAESEAET